MKKVLHDFLLLSLSIGCFFCSHAMAGEITLPLTDSTTYFDSEQEEYFATSAKYTLLQDGDIIHFLLNQELLGTSVEPFATFSATCYMIDEHGELTICTEHCSDFFSQIPPYKCTDSFNWPYFITRSAQNKTFLLHMNGDVYQWCPNGPDGIFGTNSKKKLWSLTPHASL